LDVAPISASTSHMLETGEADLALGFIPGSRPDFTSNGSTCRTSFAWSRTAPAHRHGLHRTRLQGGGHIGILSSTSYPMLQSSLKSQGIERRVQLNCPAFSVWRPLLRRRT
jgi:hypothetical protein